MPLSSKVRRLAAHRIAWYTQGWVALGLALPGCGGQGASAEPREVGVAVAALGEDPLPVGGHGPAPGAAGGDGTAFGNSSGPPPGSAPDAGNGGNPDPGPPDPVLPPAPGSNGPPAGNVPPLVETCKVSLNKICDIHADYHYTLHDGAPLGPSNNGMLPDSFALDFPALPCERHLELAPSSQSSSPTFQWRYPSSAVFSKTPEEVCSGLGGVLVISWPTSWVTNAAAGVVGTVTAWSPFQRVTWSNRSMTIGQMRFWHIWLPSMACEFSYQSLCLPGGPFAGLAPQQCPPPTPSAQPATEADRRRLAQMVEAVSAVAGEVEALQRAFLDGRIPGQERDRRLVELAARESLQPGLLEKLVIHYNEQRVNDLAFKVIASGGAPSPQDRTIFWRMTPEPAAVINNAPGTYAAATLDDHIRKLRVLHDHFVAAGGRYRSLTFSGAAADATAGWSFDGSASFNPARLRGNAGLRTALLVVYGKQVVQDLESDCRGVAVFVGASTFLPPDRNGEVVVQSTEDWQRAVRKTAGRFSTQLQRWLDLAYHASGTWGGLADGAGLFGYFAGETFEGLNGSAFQAAAAYDQLLVIVRQLLALGAPSKLMKAIFKALGDGLNAERQLIRGIDQICDRVLYASWGLVATPILIYLTPLAGSYAGFEATTITAMASASTRAALVTLGLSIFVPASYVLAQNLALEQPLFSGFLSEFYYYLTTAGLELARLTPWFTALPGVLALGAKTTGYVASVTGVGSYAVVTRATYELGHLAVGLGFTGWMGLQAGAAYAEAFGLLVDAKAKLELAKATGDELALRQGRELMAAGFRKLFVDANIDLLFCWLGVYNASTALPAVLEVVRSPAQVTPGGEVNPARQAELDQVLQRTPELPPRERSAVPPTYEAAVRANAAELARRTGVLESEIDPARIVEVLRDYEAFSASNATVARTAAELLTRVDALKARRVGQGLTGTSNGTRHRSSDFDAAFDEVIGDLAEAVGYPREIGRGPVGSSAATTMGAVEYVAYRRSFFGRLFHEPRFSSDPLAAKGHGHYMQRILFILRMSRLGKLADPTYRRSVVAAIGSLGLETVLRSGGATGSYEIAGEVVQISPWYDLFDNFHRGGVATDPWRLERMLEQFSGVRSFFIGAPGRSTFTIAGP